MASFASSATKIYCNKILPDRFDHGKDEPYFGKVKINEKTKKNLDLKLVTNVASQLPVIVPPPDQQIIKKEKKLAAWTSVCQERWEGELVVEGELPLWLTYIGDMAKLLFCASLTDNVNTGVVKLGDGRVVCLTETTKGSIYTLDTLGKFEYSDTLGGLIHSAHPIVTDSEFLTLIPDLIRPGYVVVRMEAGSNERKYIGRVSCRGGPASGWVHSFPVTEHYIIVPEMPLRYCAQNLLKAEPTPLYKFEWHPNSKGFKHVMYKASGNIVASVEVPLYVTFHFINAYEEKDEDGRVTAVIADCCEHSADTVILDKLRL
ncbi:hypothetical protein K7X08_026797 [Anisodus acutangulus]|uniref:Uncharacterized protein n=1 Tax=Anisodus acutangulus TaxID=402998 RepID=A0A9Q1LBU5_9SOLA|nr:hypothetical protein K7X08_026797 [Anisodus acutangulus]